MRPTQIKRRKEANELAIIWDSGHVSVFPIPFLRQECPCAACKGEVLFGKVYKPAPLAVFAEGMYDLKDIKPIGQYAIQAVWGDGHDTGIYSWEYLLQLEQALSQQP
jgi:DUF971 family protein